MENNGRTFFKKAHIQLLVSIISVILDAVTSLEKINRVPDTWYIDNDLEYIFIFAIPTTTTKKLEIN